MRRTLELSVCYLAMATVTSLGFVACSDDGTGGTETRDTGTISDASDIASDTESDTGGDADSGDDVGPEDVGPQDTGSDATDATDVADAADTTDATDTADSGTGQVDAGHSGCSFPADPDAGCDPEAYGDYGPASFLNEFVVKESGECCTDFDNDGATDSALGDLAGQIESILGVPFNDIIAFQIESGSLIYLFEYGYWSDSVSDPSVDFAMLFGQDTDADFGPNLAGNGDFNIDPASLDANNDPKSTFASASVNNGRLVATGGTTPLVLPVGTDLIETVVEQVRVEADVLQGADLQAGGRVGLGNGEISGLVTLQELYGSLNAVARNCSCITSDPVFAETSTDTWECMSTQADQAACENDPNASQMCKVLATPTGTESCFSIEFFVNGSADISTDADAAKEALSLGATFEAVGAHIDGVAAP